MSQRICSFDRAGLLAWAVFLVACNPLGDGAETADDPATGGTWSAPLVIVSGMEGPTALGQDAHSLYWGDDAGFVRAVSKEGGAATTLYEDVGAAVDLVVRHDTVFWLESGYGRLQSYSLETDQAFTLAVGLDEPRQLAVDDSYLYWIEADDAVLRIFLAGGYTEYLVYGAQGLAGLALDATHLYYADSNRGGIFAVPLLGGMERLLTTVSTAVASIAADGMRVYWATGTRIDSIDVTEPNAVMQTVATGLSGPQDLTAAGGYLYFAIPDDRTVMRVRKTGGSPETIAAAQEQPREVMVDTTAVYWLDGGRGEADGSLRKSVRQ